MEALTAITGDGVLVAIGEWILVAMGDIAVVGAGAGLTKSIRSILDIRVL